MFVRAVIFAVVLGAAVMVERFLLPPPREPLTWSYWVVFFVFAFVLHMWINDLLAMLRVSAAVEPYIVTYTDTDRAIPVLSRLVVLYPAFIAVSGYGIWYARYFGPGGYVSSLP